MINPDLAALLEKLKAGLESILTAENAENAEGQPELQNAEMAAQENQMQKPCADGRDLNKENAGPTANDSAEDRLNPPTDNNNAQVMAQVGKMMQDIIFQNASQNQAPGAVTQTQLLEVTKQITDSVIKAVTPITKQVQEVRTATEYMLESLGYTEQVMKEMEVPKSQPIQKSNNNPVATIDAGQFIKEFMTTYGPVNNNVQKTNTTYSNVREESADEKRRNELRKSRSVFFPGK